VARFELLQSLTEVKRISKQIDSNIVDDEIKKEMFQLGTPVAILNDEYKQIPYDGYGLVYWVISDVKREAQVYGSGIANDVLASNGLTAFYGKARVITDNFVADTGTAYAAGQELFAVTEDKLTKLSNVAPTPAPGEVVRAVALVEEVITEGTSVTALKIMIL